MAIERAANDSETAPWRPADPIAFEKTFELAPSTARDLQLVTARRLADMQHDLLHSDFAQGRTVSALPDEAAMQIWLADRLRLNAGRSYSVERESHVADEKEPDIRVRVKVTDASLPIEVKIAESWTLEELESALIDQLCGQYLRARDAQGLPARTRRSASHPHFRPRDRVDDAAAVRRVREPGDQRHGQ